MEEGADFGVTGWEKGFMPYLLGTGQVRHQRHLIMRQTAESLEFLMLLGEG